MSSELEHQLESNRAQSPREISESNKNEDHANLATESSSKDANNDHSLSKQAIEDKDHGGESVQSSKDSSNRQTQDNYRNSSMQDIHDQDRPSEGVQSPVCSSCGRTQDFGTLETRKLAKTTSDGANAATSQKSAKFSKKIHHSRSRSTFAATSQGDNSGINKWPTVTTDGISLSRKRYNFNEVFDRTKVDIDTKAPIDSVRSAASKFGGILDWNAHKIQTVERSKVIEEEIEKVEEEIPVYKEQAEIAEQSKVEMLKELENTKRLIEELKLSLEKAGIEESQAQQDCQLAKLRLEELELGVAEEACVAAKSELEMAKNRHQDAIIDLKAVKEELQLLQKEYADFLIEKDIVVNKAEDVVSASKGMERTVETLAVELVSTKETLESANAAYCEAEEQRIDAQKTKEHDLYTWDKELKEVQENLENLNQHIESSKELKSKLSKESSRLADLKSELATYMDPNISEDGETGDKTHAGMQAVILGMNNEVDDVKRRMDKAIDEVNCLKMASTTLKAELEKEESELVHLTQKEGMNSIAVASLEAEVDKIMSEISVVRKREKEAREQMEDLPKQLQHASKETEEAKSKAELAHQQMKIAKEEAELAKEGTKITESRLLAAQKEIEATRASERLALATVKILQECESSRKTNDEDSNDKVTLTLEEYYELSKKALETEQYNTKVFEALSKVVLAKEDELKSTKQLEDAIREMDERKEALLNAQERAEKAEEGKLGVEEELRKIRSEHEQRKEEETSQGTVVSPTKIKEEGQGQTHHVENQTTDALESSSPNDYNEPSPNPNGVIAHSNTIKKKKKSLFPKIFMFLGKKHWKSSPKS